MQDSNQVRLNVLDLSWPTSVQYAWTRDCRLQTSAQYGFHDMTAVQNIEYVANTEKPGLAAYLAAGGLKPVVVEASLSGRFVVMLLTNMWLVCRVEF